MILTTTTDAKEGAALWNGPLKTERILGRKVTRAGSAVKTRAGLKCQNLNPSPNPAKQTERQNLTHRETWFKGVGNCGQ